MDTFRQFWYEESDWIADFLNIEVMAGIERNFISRAIMGNRISLTRTKFVSRLRVR